MEEEEPNRDSVTSMGMATLERDVDVAAADEDDDDNDDDDQLGAEELASGVQGCEEAYVLLGARGGRVVVVDVDVIDVTLL